MKILKTAAYSYKGKIIAVFLAMIMAVGVLPATYVLAETPEVVPAPVITAPGNSMVANEDGTYTEVDEFGLALVQWIWDAGDEEWKDEPLANWIWTTETEEWVFEESDVPLTEWTFNDTMEWEFEESDVPLEEWNFGTVDEEWDFNEVPKTDDSADLILRAALFGTAVLGFATLVLMSKKSAKTKKRIVIHNKVEG